MKIYLSLLIAFAFISCQKDKAECEKNNMATVIVHLGQDSVFYSVSLGSTTNAIWNLKGRGPHYIPVTGKASEKFFCNPYYNAPMGKKKDTVINNITACKEYTIYLK